MRQPSPNIVFFSFPPEQGKSTLPDKIEKAVNNLEDDWENDPENARNWSTRKKWTAVYIVRRRFDLFFWIARNFIYISFRRPGRSLCFHISSCQLHDGAWYSGNCHEIWDYEFDHSCFDVQHIPIVYSICS